jgi:DNA-binding transcriptional ArsR family regulator
VTDAAGGAATAKEQTSGIDSGGPSSERYRHLTDPRELRAMTHPVRLALLETLSLHPSLTATEAGELIGESPTTCSFHLRQLAKYGFVEEAGDAPGRRRPWRLVDDAMSFASTTDDVEMRAASDALESLLMERWVSRLKRWRRLRHSFPGSWQAAGTATEHLVHLTPSELAEFTHSVMGLLERYRSRSLDPSARPEGSLPVEILVFGYPMTADDRARSEPEGESTALHPVEGELGPAAAVGTGGEPR